MPGALQHRGRRLLTAGCEIEPGRPAIFNVQSDGVVEEISYGGPAGNLEPARQCARRPRYLSAATPRRHRPPQGPAVAAGHIAIYKLGAVALPLAMLFGVDPLRIGFKDSCAAALITGNAQGLAKLAGIRDALAGLKLVVSVDGAAEGADFA